MEIAAKEILPEIVAWRRELHALAEVSQQLPQTAVYLARALEGIGVDSLRTGVGVLPDGSPALGIVAEIYGEKPGAVLALRTDMDALPVLEETGLPFASRNGASHACGHDANMAMMLGAVKLLAARRSYLAGTVRFIFQPAAESLDGARALLRSSVLEDVDCIVGVHTGSLVENAKPASIACRTGAMMAASDFFTATFHGVGGHGATPHRTVDSVLMVSAAVCQLQTIVSREVNPTDAAVVTVGMIQGGTAPNIIPTSCRVWGTIRSLDADVRAFLRKRVTEVCQGVAHTMRGTAEVSIAAGCPPLLNDAGVVEKMRGVVQAVLGRELLVEMSKPLMGSEDFAEYLTVTRGAYFFHDSTFGDERDYPHHHPKFQVNEDTLWSGTAALVAFALA